MIVVDTSAIVAVAMREIEGPLMSHVLASASARVMSAGAYLETAIVLSGRLGGRAVLDRWLLDRDIEVRPVDLSIAQIAADAFSRYGRGFHAAKLNYGDCFSYALAKALRAPLLFKGRDFARTDIEPALR